MTQAWDFVSARMLWQTQYELNQPITDLGLGRRVENALRNYDITTVGDLINLTDYHLRCRIPNLGRISARATLDALAARGFTLAKEQWQR